MGAVGQTVPVGGIAPMEVERPESDVRPDLPWVTIVWNDPVNLMSYVTYVFQTVFGYSREKSEKLMLDVHQKGRAVVSSGTREEMERDAQIMHSYGLWATVQHDS
nr:ATP-dependent Clp protease adapter ClpS [Streptosporangium pseudovulgare]